MFLLALVLAMEGASPAMAHEVDDAVFERVEYETGVKASLLKAISMRESGRWVGGKRTNWALAIGVNGKDGHVSHYPETRDEAIKLLGELLVAGRRNIGVGVAQINIRWNGHRVADYRHLLDPYENLRIAAELVKECWAANKTTDATLSCYANGRVTPFGIQYARTVSEEQERIEMGSEPPMKALERLAEITSIGSEPTLEELLMAYRSHQRSTWNE